MKKIIIYLAFGILFSFSLNANEAGKFSIYPIIGYTIIDVETIDDAIHYGIGIDYSIIENLAVELNYSISNHDVEILSHKTDMDIDTYGLYGAYYISALDILNIKVKAGISKMEGKAEVHHSGTTYVYRRGYSTYNIDYEVEVEDSIEFSAGLGLDFKITDSSNIDLDITYLQEDVYSASVEYKWHFG